MGQWPLVTPDLVRRLERAIDECTVEWLDIRGGASGAVRLERFADGVVAAATPSRPELDHMNRIHGLAFAAVSVVDDVLSFYRGLGLRPWAEIAPGREDVAARLADAGARPLEAVSVLYGPPERPPEPAGVEVRAIEAGEAMRFADVFLEGLGVPADLRTTDAPGVAAGHGRAGLTYYLARVDGRDAAAAVLAVRDGIGYLAGASTLPELRRRGCQTALVARRIDDARRAGCELVASLTEFGSNSQRTLERAGLRIAYTRTVWRQLRAEPSK